ncbi:MAG: hypothetical protein KGL35_11210, partial [Bradyrhizobium sp.]|nr:hypothetical protein [Bradyrhizobium sp.]
MSQKVIVGAADNPLGSQTYGNQSMIDYEEQSTANNGFGVRMTGCRTYHNYFTQVMTSGGLDENRLKSGHVPIISVNHPQKVKAGFTYHLFATTTQYDTDAKNMLTRIALEPFDAPVAGGSTYGGLNAAFAYFTLSHEIDRETPHPGTELYPGDTPADWIASWIKLWNFWQAIAAANGVPTSRIRWNWIITVSNLSTADTFYPGDKYVDVIGFDPYTGPTNPASFSSLCSAAFAYARKKNKPIGFGEINIRHTGDSTALQNWWIDAGNQINNLDLTVEYLCIWPSGPQYNGTSYYQYNINKVADTNGHAFPDAHAGFLTMINALGGNAIRTSVGQALPAAPTGLSVTPASNGQSAAAS